MDFLTEILVSFILGVMVYYGLLRSNISKDNALIAATFIGGWIFSQLPKMTRKDNEEADTYSTLRSYLVGFILIGVISNKFLGGGSMSAFTLSGPRGYRMSTYRK
jgi:hypothetical protein